MPGADVGRNGLATWLLAHQTTEDWIAATSGAMDAASLQLAAGRPVMAMGGFIGSDPSPTLAQLQALVAEGRLRYVLLSRGQGLGGFLGGSNNRTRDDWVRPTAWRSPTRASAAAAVSGRRCTTAPARGDASVPHDRRSDGGRPDAG